MKARLKVSLPISLSILLLGCVVSNPKLFSEVKPTTDSTYGYSVDNPLLIKNGDIYSSMDAERYFLQHLTTAKQERLEYISRVSMSNPNFKSTGLQNRFTGMPMVAEGRY